MEHDGVAISSYPRVRALYSYTGRSEKELSFKANDLLTVLDIVSETWWEGAFNGVKGYIPAAYVEHAPVDSADHASEPRTTSGSSSSITPAVAAAVAEAPVQDATYTPHDDTPSLSAAAAAEAAAVDDENQEPAHVSELGAVPEAPPPPPTLMSELHGQIDARAPAVQVLAEGQGRASEGSPMVARRAKADEDRPDLATALRIHQMKSKHRDLAPRKGGPNEIQQQLHRMQSRRGDKQAEAAASETEFARAMRSQRDRMELQQKEQEKEANMSELEKRFLARRNTERHD